MSMRFALWLLPLVLIGTSPQPDAQRGSRGGGPAGQSGGKGGRGGKKPGGATSQPKLPPLTPPKRVPTVPGKGPKAPAGGLGALFGAGNATGNKATEALAAALLGAADQAALESGPQDPHALEELAEFSALEGQYFETADYDASGWISFREATQSLGLERSEFRSFDPDRDGRIRPDEFGQRFRETVTLVGSFQPPVPASAGMGIAPAENATALDPNGDGRVDAAELGSALVTLGMKDIDPRVVLERFDLDADDALDSDELATATADLASLQGESIAPSDTMAAIPTNVDDLFLPPGTESPIGRYGLPTLDGPLTHFRRLDFDDDGLVEPEDLLRLESPTQLPVRARAIVAFLDANGDGTLSRSELNAAFYEKGTAPQPR